MVAAVTDGQHRLPLQPTARIDMHPSLRASQHLQSPPSSAKHPIRSAVAAAVVGGLLGTLGACGGVSSLTKERVAQSDTSVQQTQQAIGSSEHGAVELQQAREKLSAAKIALAAGQQQQAERAAAQAHLYAELAMARSQSAQARKGAAEGVASLEMLRQEAERTTSPPR